MTRPLVIHMVDQKGLWRGDRTLCGRAAHSVQEVRGLKTKAPDEYLCGSCWAARRRMQREGQL